MVKLLTTAVQNTSEPKIDVMGLKQSKKTDETVPFGDCLRTLEAAQNLSEEVKNKNINKEKKAEEFIPVDVVMASVTPASVTPASVTPASVAPASVAPASVTPASVTPASVTPASVTPASVTPASVAPTNIAPTSVTPATATPANADTVSEAGVSTINFSDLSQKQKNETAEIGKAANKSESPGKTDSIAKDGLANYSMPKFEKAEETALEKPKTAAEIKNGMSLSAESQVKSTNINDSILKNTANNSENLAEKSSLKSEKGLALAPGANNPSEVKVEIVSEMLPQKVDNEKPLETAAELRKSSGDGNTTNNRNNVPEANTLPLLSNKKTDDNPNGSLLKEKTAQNKAEDTKVGKETEIFSLPQKETALKQAANKEKALAGEAQATAVYSAKENKSVSAISGENVLSQVTRAVNEIKKPENSSLILELSPKELGKIKVEMKFTDGKLNVVLTAENNETANVLSGQLAQLKTALTANKVEIQHVEVNNSSQLDLSFSNMSSFGERSAGEDRGLYYNKDIANYRNFDEKADSAKPLIYPRQNQLLNYLA